MKEGGQEGSKKESEGVTTVEYICDVDLASMGEQVTIHHMDTSEFLLYGYMNGYVGEYNSPEEKESDTN